MRYAPPVTPFAATDRQFLPARPLNPKNPAMANETQQTEAPAQAPPAPEKSKAQGPAPMVLIGAVVGALIGGAAAGNFLIAPRFTPKTIAQTAEQSGDAKKKDSKKKGAHGDVKPSIHKIENLIVNPAGSEGQHFLMTTIAIECADDKVNDALRDHDAEVRDAVIATLEGQTLQMLTRPGARDTLKRRIENVVAPLVGEEPEALHVFLPQFVIQ